MCPRHSNREFTRCGTSSTSCTDSTSWALTRATDRSVLQEVRTRLKFLHILSFCSLLFSLTNVYVSDSRRGGLPDARASGAGVGHPGRAGRNVAVERSVASQLAAGRGATQAVRLSAHAVRLLPRCKSAIHHHQIRHSPHLWMCYGMYSLLGNSKQQNLETE